LVDCRLKPRIVPALSLISAFWHIRQRDKEAAE
jgi:hypothetical protein